MVRDGGGAAGWRRWAGILGVAAGALVAAGCSALPGRPARTGTGGPAGIPASLGHGSGGPPSVPGGTPRPGGTGVRLVSYGDCDALLEQLKAEALAEVGPYGLTTGGGPAGVPERNGARARPEAGAAAGAAGGSEQPGAAGAQAGSTPAPTSASAGPSYSTTNDQEAGVDEPDLAKTDGKLMVVLRHDPLGLQVVEVGGGHPSLAGFAPLSQMGSLTGLFLVGSDAVVVGGAAPPPQVYSGPAGGPPGYTYPDQGAATTAVIVSLAEPAHPKVVRSLSLDGREVDARLVGGRVLVVLQGGPALPFGSPRDNSSAEQQRALEHNRDVVRSSTLAQWLPATRDAGSRTRSMPACPAVLHPNVASGLGTVSVVSLDPVSGTAGPEVTVVGNASVVYASTAAMYLATSSWADQVVEGREGGAAVTTDIHGFSLGDPTTPRYLGSGSVRGVLTDQYAMSEYGGVLRVATTVGQAYAPVPQPGAGDHAAAPSDRGASDNLVTALRPVGGALVPVGTIDGLGRGERIYGVRFVGALGYVVTFRQTDPLFVIDLTDPRHPSLRGQLQLTGFSAYLHPLGGGMLLGLGQETDRGGDGVQVSVFDVSDPTRPVLDARRYLDSSYSAAERDPHAFLWWQPRGLAIIPVQQYSAGAGFDGEVVFRVGADGSLVERGRISQPDQTRPQPQPGPEGQGSGTAPGTPGAEPVRPVDGTMMAPAYSPGIERALIVGGLIYTVSDSGILATDADSLVRVAWLPFPPGQ